MSTDPLSDRPAAKGASPSRPRRGLLQDANTMALSALVFGVWALAASMFAVALAAQAVQDARSSGTGGTTSQSSGGTLTLKEFAIDPGTLIVAAGTTLRVENAGSVTHNLSIDGSATPMLEKGMSANLDLASLAPGTYTMRCDVAGHEAAGMKGSLTIK